MCVCVSVCSSIINLHIDVKGTRNWNIGCLQQRINDHTTQWWSKTCRWNGNALATLIYSFSWMRKIGTQKKTNNNWPVSIVYQCVQQICHNIRFLCAFNELCTHYLTVLFRLCTEFSCFFFFAFILMKIQYPISLLIFQYVFKILLQFIFLPFILCHQEIFIDYIIFRLYFLVYLDFQLNRMQSDRHTQRVRSKRKKFNIEKWLKWHFRANTNTQFWQQ